tara:strand:- start:26 stop:514 length:489 start_codon:yes stop_codon:yes gene_type:complete
MAYTPITLLSREVSGSALSFSDGYFTNDVSCDTLLSSNAGIGTDDPQTVLDVSGALSCSTFFINAPPGNEGAQMTLNFGGSRGGESATAFSIDVLKDVGNTYGHGVNAQLLRIFHGSAPSDTSILIMSTDGHISMPNLPTSAPTSNLGLLYRDGDFVKITHA